MDISSLETIGSQLRAFRKQQKLTQEQVACKALISRQNVSDIERGRFVGAISTLIKYLTLANMDLTASPKPHRFPQFEELGELFPDE